MKSAIYLIKSNNLVKIGFSNNPWKRYMTLPLVFSGIKQKFEYRTIQQNI